MSSEPALIFPAVRSGHPPHLLEADRPYLVRWGKQEMLRLTAALLAAGAVLLGVAAGLRLWWILGAEILPAALLVLGVLFFRNPRRRPPAEPGLLVSPADGRVVEVSRVEEWEYLQGPAIKVGIFLSIFDVHVNRAPGDGRVEHLRYRPGRFLDARDPRSILENESQSIGMTLAEEGAAGGGGAPRILIRQISGAIARRLVCPLAVGDALARGGLIGMIKYGSRTELYVPAGRPEAGGPPGWEAAVRPGDKVRGGETVLFKRQP